MLNDSQIKVIQADGTFKCVPDKNTGFYQLLVVKAIVKGESRNIDGKVRNFIYESN